MRTERPLMRTTGRILYSQVEFDGAPSHVDTCSQHTLWKRALLQSRPDVLLRASSASSEPSDFYSGGLDSYY